MNRRLTTGIVISLVVCVVLGNVYFRNMMVCIHGDGGYGEKAVHLHFGQLPDQPCGESREGLCHETREEGPRHFSLAPETLMNVQASFKRVLSLLPYAGHLSPESTMDPPAISHGGYGFKDPFLVFPDTAFTDTTILII